MVHEQAFLTKSILFSLVPMAQVPWHKEKNASQGCNEFGVNMLDMTSTIIAGKYPEKDGPQNAHFHLA